MGSVLLAAAALAPLLRQRGVATWRVLFAEDGLIFAQGARDHGLGSVFDGYAGYEHLVPRLLSLPLTPFDVDDLALVNALAATTAVAFVALFVWWAAAPAMQRRGGRLVLGASCVAAPVLLTEVTAVLANVNWVLLFACFWALASLREGRRDGMLRGGVAFLAAASTPLVALYAPAVGYLALRRRTPATVAALVGWGAGLLVQVVVMLSTEDETNAMGGGPVQLPGLFGIRVLGSWLIGDRFLDEAWDALGWWIAVVSLVAFAVVLALAVASRAPASAADGSTAVVVLALVSAVILFVVPLLMRGPELMELSVGEAIRREGSRYGVAPVLLLVSGLLVLTDGSRCAVLRLAVVAHLVVVGALSFRDANFRSPGPPWRNEVGAAAERCRTSGADRAVVIGVLTQLEVDCEEITSP